jgi:DNA repair protein RecO
MNIRGFILRNTPYRNHDGILTILTPNGYHTVHARGIFKMTSAYSAATTPGTLADLKLTATKQKMYLESATVSAFTPLPETDGLLASLMMAAALEISLLNDDDTAAPDLFHALETFRTSLNHPYISWAIFLHTFLKIQGIPMTVDHCVRCQKTQRIVGLSASLGGFICQDCLPHVKANILKASQLKTILTLSRHPDQLVDAEVQSILPYIHDHLAIHLDVDLQGLSTLESVLTK